MNSEAVAAINAQTGHHGSTFSIKDVEEPKAKHSEEDENSSFEGVDNTLDDPKSEAQAAMSFASSKADKPAPKVAPAIQLPETQNVQEDIRVRDSLEE